MQKFNLSMLFYIFSSPPPLLGLKKVKNYALCCVQGAGFVL